MDKGSHVREMTNVYNERGPSAVVWLHSTGALGESASRGNAILIETAAPLFGVGKTRLFWLRRVGPLRLQLLS